MQPEIVHCLQCDNVFEENAEFIEVCPCCDNDDPMYTVYMVTKENDNAYAAKATVS